MAISTNQKATIYRNLYENTAPSHTCKAKSQYMLAWKVSRYWLLALHGIQEGNLDVHLCVFGSWTEFEHFHLMTFSKTIKGVLETYKMSPLFIGSLNRLRRLGIRCLGLRSKIWCILYRPTHKSSLHRKRRCTPLMCKLFYHKKQSSSLWKLSFTIRSVKLKIGI